MNATSVPLSVEHFRAIERVARTLPPDDNGFEINAAIEWQETVAPPARADDFAREAIFVICNSGMKHTVARKIFDRVMLALDRDEPARSVFGHTGKAAAIEKIWISRERLFAAFSGLASDRERLDFCAQMPWIGDITKYHLAKNFGIDVAKPDVHLDRLARAIGTTPQSMCAGLAAATGYRIATVDLILWFACARGVIDSRSPTPFARFLPDEAAP